MTLWIDGNAHRLAGCHTALDENTRAFEARRANVAALNGTCPHCGQRIPQSPPDAPITTAAPDAQTVPPAKATNIAHEPPPSGWRDREKLT